MGFFDDQPAETDIRDIRAYFLNYDIPDNAEIANPAGFLRRFAFHAQLSGWIVQEGDIPWGLIGRLQAAGATVDLIKFDSSETPKLLAMAARSIEAEITERRRSAAQSYANACQELRDNEIDADTALTKFKRKSAQIVKRLTEHLDDVTACAKRWNVDANIPCLRTSMTGIAAMRQTVKVRAAAYARAIQEIKRKQGTNDPIAVALEGDNIPAGIAADYMDDLGLNGQALRSAFF